MPNKSHYMQLIEHTKSGLKNEEIAKRMGVCRKTIYNWKKALRNSVEDQIFLIPIMLNASNDLKENGECFRKNADRLQKTNIESISDLNALRSAAFDNSKKTANLIKGLGLVRFTALHEEIKALENKLDEAKLMLSVVILNRVDLEAGINEVNPEIYDDIREFLKEE